MEKHEDKWSGFDRWCEEEKKYVFDPATHEETTFIPPRSLEIAEKLTKPK
jgi:hypothetical protein